jgi:hypothetical protein
MRLIKNQGALCGVSFTRKSNDKQSSESIIDDISNSILTIEISLASSQPILAVSPDNILLDTKRKKQLVMIDHHLKKRFTLSPITEPVIDSLWYVIEQMFYIFQQLICIINCL